MITIDVFHGFKKMKSVKKLILISIIGAVLAIKGEVLPLTDTANEFLIYYRYLFIFGLIIFVVSTLRLLFVLNTGTSNHSSRSTDKLNALGLGVDEKGRIKGTSDINWKLVLGIVLSIVVVAIVTVIF